MSRPNCPEVHNLQALLEESSTGSEPEELLHHLETCADCRQTLETLAADAGVWEDTAQGLTDAVREEPALRQAVEQLKGEDTLLTEDEVQAFLRPSDKLGLLGLLGEYEVLEEIGRGGMGVVLKALDPALNRLVAIKVLSPYLASSRTARLRFVREGRATAAVCHGHVVTVYAVHETDGLPYLVMQYVAGESVQARLDRGGPLEVEEIVRIGLQTARGLAAAHAQGLIHRDIKPANLLLEDPSPPTPRQPNPSPQPPPRSGEGEPEGSDCVCAAAQCNPSALLLPLPEAGRGLGGGVERVKITDFGLARLVDDVGLTRTGVVAGTPEYMAPEQARGEPIDHRADLFSLGSVLYALCTGSSPFRSSTALAVLRRVSDEAPLPIRSLNPDVPDWLETLIARLLAKDPDDRFQSATEVADLLEGYLAHLEQPGVSAAPKLPALPASASRISGGWRRRSWLVALLLLAVSILGTAFWLLAGGGQPQQAEKVADKPRLQQHLAYDFRAGVANLPPHVFTGEDSDSVIKTDASGLRITLPANRQHRGPVGVDLPIWLRGDFDVSLGYEFLALGENTPPYGAGVALRVFFGEPSSLAALMSRTRKQPVGELFGTFKLVKNAKGTYDYLETLEPKATAPRGRMRMVRTGTQLHFLASEGGSAFRELRPMEIGTEDVRLVRMYCSTDWKPFLLDMSFTDIDVWADSIQKQVAVEPPAAPQEPERSKSRLGLVVGLLLVLLLLFGLAGVWVARRRGPEDDPSEEAPAADSTQALAFSCEACGKHLKVRAELAGKKVKCPRCGQAVLVAKSGKSSSDSNPC